MKILWSVQSSRSVKANIENQAKSSSEKKGEVFKRILRAGDESFRIFMSTKFTLGYVGFSTVTKQGLFCFYFFFIKKLIPFVNTVFRIAVLTFFKSICEKPKTREMYVDRGEADSRICR